MGLGVLLFTKLLTAFRLSVWCSPQGLIAGPPAPRDAIQTTRARRAHRRDRPAHSLACVRAPVAAGPARAAWRGSLPRAFIWIRRLCVAPRGAALAAPEARLLLALSVVPRTISVYELVPLFVISRTRMEPWLLVCRILPALARGALTGCRPAVPDECGFALASIRPRARARATALK